MDKNYVENLLIEGLKIQVVRCTFQDCENCYYKTSSDSHCHFGLEKAIDETIDFIRKNREEKVMAINIEDVIKSHEETIEKIRKIRKALDDCNRDLDEYKKKIMANKEEL